MMPDLTTKDALLERMVAATDALATEVPAALEEKAPLDSPAFTGTPTAPTPTAGDNSTNIATTAFIKTAIQTNAIGNTKDYTPAITNSADLNTYTTPGSYRCESSSVAASLSNSPYTSSNFTLWVICGGGAGNSKYTRQILLTTADNTNGFNFIFTRSCDGNGGNWSTWKKLAYDIVGVVQIFAGSTTPTGWLLCDGRTVSRTTYADLYAVIGDTYGAGDGSTTFNLPDLSGESMTHIIKY